MSSLMKWTSAAVTFWPLKVGLTLIRINSTLDGYYVVAVTRAVPDITSITASPLTYSPGYFILPATPFVSAISHSARSTSRRAPSSSPPSM